MCPPAFRVSSSLRLCLCNLQIWARELASLPELRRRRQSARSLHQLRHRKPHPCSPIFRECLTPNQTSSRIDRSGPVAQLGARFHGMEEVIGSIPIRSTNQSLQLRPHSPSGQSFQVVAFDPASTVAWKASGLKLHKLRVPLRRNDKLGSQQTLLLILRNMRPVHDIGNKLRAKRKIDIVAVDIPHLLLIDDE
jgi:hypothetical protein